MQYKAVKGFKDTLPDKVETWGQIEFEAKRLFDLFGYKEIRVPVLERAELFARGIGRDTDIVSKEMYTFQDRKGTWLAMRPEATASILRAFIEHKMHEGFPVHKLFTIGPMFRYERPQKGRRRQFHQIDVEIIGDAGPRSDSELIYMIMQFFSLLKLPDLVLQINSLGCERCRAPFKTVLREYLNKYFIQLCPDCRNRMDTNPLRVFDCKVEDCKQVILNAPSVLDFLCSACNRHFDDVMLYLKKLDMDFEVNPGLMRGLDYYTRTTFEVRTRELGAQNAVAGGGRYDNLMKEFGGPDIPAIGFAIGEERIVEILEEHFTRKADGPDIFLVALGKEAEDKVFIWLQELRRYDIKCEMNYQSQGLKAQMRYADRLGAKKVLIVGEDELIKGKGILRDMFSKEQTGIPLDNVIDRLMRLVKL
ncbi:MAG TPA: histidine--tRNA ligase [Desulfatiglandales bacterium]|nr:histidine--tRNA ligase [Desulfatiglandales bacterium]